MRCDQLWCVFETPRGPVLRSYGDVGLFRRSGVVRHEWLAFVFYQIIHFFHQIFRFGFIEGEYPR